MPHEQAMVQFRVEAICFATSVATISSMCPVRLITETVALVPLPVRDGRGTARATHPTCALPPLMVIVQSSPAGITSPQISQAGQLTRYSMYPLPRWYYLPIIGGLEADFAMNLSK